MLLLPGYGDSGPAHWQSRWEAADPQHYIRLHQRDWLQPRLDDWMANLERAVPDPSGPHFPPAAADFAGPPRQALRFPSVVVISDDDPYGSPAYAHRCASTWGARTLRMGARGHLNADSGLGDWPQGLALLDQL